MGEKTNGKEHHIVEYKWILMTTRPDDFYNEQLIQCRIVSDCLPESADTLAILKYKTFASEKMKEGTIVSPFFLEQAV